MKPADALVTRHPQRGEPGSAEAESWPVPLFCPLVLDFCHGWGYSQYLFQGACFLVQRDILEQGELERRELPWSFL